MISYQESLNYKYNGKNVYDRLFSKIDIKSLDECWIWQGTNVRGYGYIGAKSGKSVRVPRLIFMLADGQDIPESMCVCHTCDNPSCCNPYHLWLGTQQDNIRDKKGKGRAKGVNIGEKHGRAKLTESDVKEIRRLLCEKVTQRKIAEKFGVDQSAIHLIGARKTWKHLSLHGI